MIFPQQNQVETTINELYRDAKNDYLKMIKGAARSIFRPMKPVDFKDVYLAISKEQGKDLVRLIKAHNFKNIVEFGTSFGISTLFLAQGVAKTGGRVITTELIETKANKAMENFKRAGVHDLIELRIGNALKTLKDHNAPIDLLLLDGWKDLYLPLFQMLEPNFHNGTIVYVDNADMAESQVFLKAVRRNSNYQLQSENDGKVVLISLK